VTALRLSPGGNEPVTVQDVAAGKPEKLKAWLKGTVINAGLRVAGVICAVPEVVAWTAADAVPEPLALLAETVIIYEVPVFSPLIVIGFAVPVNVIGVPPAVGVAVTVNDVIGLPGVETAVKLTSSWPAPAGVTVTPDGAAGIEIGVAVTEADAALVPIAFAAVTVKEYAVPLVSPGTVIGLDEPVTVIGAPPAVGVAVTVYPLAMIALPPSEEGGEKVTVACVSPTVTTTSCGAEGTPSVEPDAAADVPAPAALTALIAKLYAVPAERLEKILLVVDALLPDMVVHVPPSIEYSYPVILLPPLLAGAVHVRVN